MGKIEQEKPLSGPEMSDHISKEVHTNARRILVRNNELRGEVSQRPGAEAYLFDLEKIREEAEKIENTDWDK
ncbi:MAG: hypothetical protein A2359_00120 [Candidatus Moranbacteria bacterium RIFOXYB1_FULL_43_19]|nr:MAG: hypothetical protein A2359_00120 [Candidatus Moranbacteria bacterium RIFOXYB1_FULL_43_19]OGI28280.1 MAG: hypothetical protein A2184_04290 [Candidatus Moranbacteria bacterium RIFOXYA1_FULL_44_7]OGI33872.1 MAG: hypothetical protein A2420_03800 [Candidatus Moranbacteria bacterium RIFOXYC1_FULL_44_13]OGI38062.1 MAG: hypothetical protein A2612_02785 [Candidatus Moranbacteria bacterium RIFOXYD1_FULL_44_12]